MSDDLDLQTPHLTDAVRDVLRINHDAAYRQIVVAREGPAEARKALAELDAYKLTRTFPAAPKAAEAALAGLWLWHDFLDESHEISQGIDNPTGSFWHAIMHRREGDFSNARYWFRNVGDHPLYPVLAAHASDLVGGRDAEPRVLRLTLAGWDPMAMVDLCEAAEAGEVDRELAVSLQHLEWRLLFDDCVREAVS